MSRHHRVCAALLLGLLGLPPAAHRLVPDTPWSNLRRGSARRWPPAYDDREVLDRGFDP